MSKLRDSKARADILNPAYRSVLINWPEQTLDDLLAVTPEFVKNNTLSSIAVAALAIPSLVRALAQTANEHAPTFTRLVRTVLATPSAKLNSLSVIISNTLNHYLDRPVLIYLLSIPPDQLSENEELLEKFCAGFAQYSKLLDSIGKYPNEQSTQVLNAHGLSSLPKDIFTASNKIALSRALLELEAIGPAIYTKPRLSDDLDKKVSPTTTIDTPTEASTNTSTAPPIFTPEDEIIRRLGGDATMRKRLTGLEKATGNLYKIAVANLACLPAENQRSMIQNGNRNAYAELITYCPATYIPKLIEKLSAAKPENLHVLLIQARKIIDTEFHTALSTTSRQSADLHSMLQTQLPFSKIPRAKLHEALIAMTTYDTPTDLCFIIANAYIAGQEALLELSTRAVHKLPAQDARALLGLYRSDEDIAAGAGSDITPEKLYPMLSQQ